MPAAKNLTPIARNIISSLTDYSSSPNQLISLLFVFLSYVKVQNLARQFHSIPLFNSSIILQDFGHMCVDIEKSQ